jgi:SMI1 / KNR4 family (SUKH-1)
MGIKNITQSVQAIVLFWEKQKLKIAPGKLDKFEVFETRNGYKLPNDFREFYSKINGMEALYPNYTDDNGFLLYPIEAIIPANTEFKNSKMKNVDRVFIFCDYLQRSWQYGCEVIDINNYIIGIIPDINTFKPISSSLIEFLELYMSDSPKLYDYNL